MKSSLSPGKRIKLLLKKINMNILTLNPTTNKFKFSLIDIPSKDIHLHGEFIDSITPEIISENLQSVFYKVCNFLNNKNQQRLDVIVVRAIYGGDEFTEPTIVNPYTINRLTKLMPAAPIHTPALITTIQKCANLWPDTPVVLAFETSFFADLPAREKFYAIDTQITHFTFARRQGYHGLTHETALNYVTHKHQLWDKSKNNGNVISFYLGPKPELVAIMNHKPIMVTSGATPLEGLPGYTTAGEIDPSLVIKLASKPDWGIEKVNQILTQESGLKALAETKLTIAEIFSKKNKKVEFAKKYFLYKTLQAIGSAAACLGSIDVIVFSGEESNIGSAILENLKPRPTFLKTNSMKKSKVEFFNESIDQVLAEIGVTTLLKSRSTLRRPA